MTDWTFTFSWHFLHLETELLLLPVYNYYFSKFSIIYASSSRRISHLIFLPLWDLNWFLPLKWSSIYGSLHQYPIEIHFKIKVVLIEYHKEEMTLSRRTHKLVHQSVVTNVWPRLEKFPQTSNQTSADINLSFFQNYFTLLDSIHILALSLYSRNCVILRNTLRQTAKKAIEVRPENSRL